MSGSSRSSRGGCLARNLERCAAFEARAPTLRIDPGCRDHIRLGAPMASERIAARGAVATRRRDDTPDSLPLQAEATAASKSLKPCERSGVRTGAPRRRAAIWRTDRIGRPRPRSASARRGRARMRERQLDRGEASRFGSPATFDGCDRRETGSALSAAPASNLLVGAVGPASARSTSVGCESARRSSSAPEEHRSVAPLRPGARSQRMKP